MLVERLALGPAKAAVGCDISSSALACASKNLQTSERTSEVALVRGDAGALPFATAAFDTVVADLPYGMLVGASDELRSLYPGFVAEATRVTAPGGVMVVITQRRALLETAIAPHGREWQLERMVGVKIPFQSGMLTPAIFAFRRT